MRIRQKFITDEEIERPPLKLGGEAIAPWKLVHDPAAPDPIHPARK